MDTLKAIEQEKTRLRLLLDGAGLTDKRRAALEAIIDNLAFQRVKLEQTVSRIADEDLSIPFDNGGGQTGVRENPAYRSYVSLWKSYLSGIEKLIAALPVEEQTAPEDAQNGDNVLQMIMNRKRGIS